MKRTGAFLAVYALEQIGVRYTFGIPGVHNTEMYDALESSEQITPVLVTHEGGAAFMADGVSRTSDTIGTCVIVPAAGLTHAMSGIGEAFLDGIPVLIISGGTRRDTGKHYQLHQIDQGRILDGIIKKYYLIKEHKDVIETIYGAYETAISGEPGPVFIEIPAEIQLFEGEVEGLLIYTDRIKKAAVNNGAVKDAATLLASAKHPGIFVGWGAVRASDITKKIAELLAAPVATTMQGLSAFPGNHPLHAGVGFGPAAVPAAQNAFKNCDCLLAVGTRFAELATGSFGVTVPENLIHIDINHDVFNKNYKARVTITGDSEDVLKELLKELESLNIKHSQRFDLLKKNIHHDKESYFSEWRKDKNKEKVSPGWFFQSLRRQLPDDAIMVVDDGKHTFLAAELFPVHTPRHFISPTDFNCMGYCVPAAIGAKLANPDKTVVAIVGDGAFLMTGMELLTAVGQQAGIMVFVFHDGELGQISEFQITPLNRKTCTVLPDYNAEGFALATGAGFLSLENDEQIDETIEKAKAIAETGQPVIVDIDIDYTKKTFLTKGVMKVNLARFTTSEKVRFIARAIKRRIF